MIYGEDPLRRRPGKSTARRKRRPGEIDGRGLAEWRKIRANGLPDEGRTPKSGHRMATEGMPLPWWWNGGTISTVLDVIWGMSAKPPDTRGMSRECRGVPTLHEIGGAPAVQPPNWPNQPRRSPRNVPTRTRMDFDSRVCCRFRPEGDAIWGISVPVLLMALLFPWENPKLAL